MKWFNNIRIRSKLYLVFGLLVCIIIAFASFNVFVIMNINNRTDKVIHSYQARQICIADAIVDFYSIRFSNLSRGYLLEDDNFIKMISRILEDYDKNVESFVENINNYREIVLSDSNYTETERRQRLVILNGIDDSFVNYMDTVDQLKDAVDNMDKQELFLIYEKSIPIGNNLSEQLQDLRDLAFFTTKLKVTEATNDASRTLKIIFTITVGSIFLSVLVMLFSINSLSKPISNLEKAVTEIADGNLTYQIRSERKDELGSLSNHIGDMVDKISEHRKIIAIMDNIDSMICVSDFEYNLLFVNKCLVETFGLDRENCMKEKCYKAIRNRESPCTICQLCKLLPDIDSLPTHSFDYIWDDTLNAWLGGTDAIIRWIDGSLVHFQTMRDVTQKKYQEELFKHQNAELALQTSKIQTIFDSIPDLLFVKDLNSCFVQCNHAMENLFGCRNEDIIGKNEIDALGFDAETAEQIFEYERAIFNEGGQVIIEENITTPNGKHIFETIKVPLKQNDTIIGLIGIVREITKRKEMEEKALSASKAKSDFLSTMSHEIRTPLNAILGITEIQLQDETLAPNLQEALNKIYNSGDLLLTIINDILDLSKIEAGKLELITTNYEVASLINDTVSLNMIRVGSKPIEFVLFVDENIPSSLYGDELRIKQILNNLLSNAFKYTEKGMVKLSVSAEISIESEDKESDITLVFEVSDTGQGMTEEQVNKLFDEYARFNTNANRIIEGTGLGMNITNNLIKIMNGSISVESKVNRGSVFTIRLPQKSIGSDVLGKELAENLQNFQINGTKQIKRAQIMLEEMPYGNVLVVDDVESNLYVAKGLMASYKLSVDTAMSGFEAIEKIKSGSVYDVVFMDHMMPKMDGLETVKNIRELGYTQPIVALTANAVVGQSKIFLANGFDDFISKPIDVRQLNTVLKQFIRDKQPPEVIEVMHRQTKEEQRENISGNIAEPVVNPKLIEIFLNDVSKSLKILDAIYIKCGDLESEDIQIYTITVHGLKSALANIGENELSGIAKKLEEAGREKNVGIISEETPSFLNELRVMVEKLTPLKEENRDIEEATDEDYIYLCEKMFVIKKACEIYDKKTAKDVMSGLKQKSWLPTIKEILSAMDEYLLSGDFEELSTTAEIIINRSKRENKI